MTNEEAIRKIKDFALHHAIGDLPHSARTVEAFEMAIEALEKAEKYRWHDLRKNPEDLPKSDDGGLYEIVLKCKYSDYMRYSHAMRIMLSDDGEYWLDNEYGFLNHPKYKKGCGGDEKWDVVAWRRVDPFENEVEK